MWEFRAAEVPFKNPVLFESRKGFSQSARGGFGGDGRIDRSPPVHPLERKQQVLPVAGIEMGREECNDFPTRFQNPEEAR